MANLPENLMYTVEHEWIDQSKSPVSIGITEIATEALGDIVYVELPEVGADVTSGEIFGEVESTKSVSALYAPVTGTVTAINETVVEDPAMINEDPYGEGWLIRVEVKETGALLSAADYAAAQE